MFKQILLIIIILLLTFFIVKQVLLYYYKLVISKSIIKYNLSDNIKNFFDSYSHEFDISFLKLLSSGTGIEKNVLFYTETPWSTKNNNYIYSIKESKYYIIDKNYYYYLDSIDNFEINIGSSENKKVKIKLFDYSANFSKISFI
jgi:hypothetical protein